jgi:hypothetical protein
MSPTGLGSFNWSRERSTRRDLHGNRFSIREAREE